MLNIEKSNNESQMTITLEGRLDTITSPDLEKEIVSSLDEAGELILDFKKIEYISSAGLRVILLAQKSLNEKGCTMKVINVNETIMGIFEMTGFSDFLIIE